MHSRPIDNAMSLSSDSVCVAYQPRPLFAYPSQHFAHILKPLSRPIHQTRLDGRRLLIIWRGVRGWVLVEEAEEGRRGKTEEGGREWNNYRPNPSGASPPRIPCRSVILFPGVVERHGPSQSGSQTRKAAKNKKKNKQRTFNFEMPKYPISPATRAKVKMEEVLKPPPSQPQTGRRAPFPRSRRPRREEIAQKLSQWLGSECG